MTHPLITIAVVPRETFACAERSLESILKHTTMPHKLLYVDGNSPDYVQRYLDQKSSECRLQLLRTEAYLSPNEARNIALEHATTKYVVFIDNDVLVSAGWLEALLACAEETAAAVVGPLYCEFEPIGTQIHMAGGEVSLGPGFYEKHWFQHMKVKDVQSELKRRETRLIEFHTVLIRRDIMETVGPFDEGLLSAAEHTDFCYRVTQAGEKIYIEPKSVITYVPPKELDEQDREYFNMRWSVAWNRATIQRLQKSWNIPASDRGLRGMDGWLDEHRRHGLNWLPRLRRKIGRKPTKLLVKWLIAPLERRKNNREFRSSVPRKRPEVKVL